MKNKKLLSIWLILCLCLQLALPVYATQPPTETEPETSQTVTDSTIDAPTDPQPTVPGNLASTSNGSDSLQALAPVDAVSLDCAAAMLLELNTGTLVYGKNIDERREPASITKVMTCLLALERGNLSDQITVSESALADLDPYGSSADLVVGETFSLKELLYCLMISSANDAGPVIGEYISGSTDAFIDLMNQRAAELGCTGTHFANPHGLHDDDHYTTARDLSRIMLEAIKNETFLEIISTPRHYIPATNMTAEERILDSTNYFISNKVTSDYYDSRVIGGKTGFTTPAGRCIMFLAEDNDLKYLCIILGAETYITEESTTYGSFTQGKKLIDFGFDHYTTIQVLSPLAPVAQLPVQDATDSVVLIPASGITTLLPTDYDSEKLTVSYTLNDANGLTAPLDAGQIVGKVQQFYDGVCIAESDLITMTQVQKNVIAYQAEQVAQKVSAKPWGKIVLVLVAVLLLIILSLLCMRAASIRKHKRRRAKQQNRRKPS
ncbi:MAG: D-alanyl-D-alanine carboxypeptidase [Oscillospiraceae bacterium]|nr:D-alanyl-D-alanine carboxypeptidase [Oscillospiraceae bacterium]